MLKRAIKSYYRFFDEKLENGTIVVLFISFLIVSIWALSPINSFAYTKTSVLDYENISPENSFFVINWKKYKLVLE